MSDDRHGKERGAPVAVIISSRTGAESEGTLYRCDLSGGARAVRAVKALALCWALAVAAVFLPVAHFALVPGFALAGPIAAWVRFRPRSLVLGGRGTCPACDADLVTRRQPEEWPLAASCESCMEQLELRRAVTYRSERATSAPDAARGARPARRSNR